MNILSTNLLHCKCWKHWIYCAYSECVTQPVWCSIRYKWATSCITCSRVVTSRLDLGVSQFKLSWVELRFESSWFCWPQPLDFTTSVGFTQIWLEIFRLLKNCLLCFPLCGAEFENGVMKSQVLLFSEEVKGHVQQSNGFFPQIFFCMKMALQC